jgi:hypothetical protein
MLELSFSIYCNPYRNEHFCKLGEQQFHLGPISMDMYNNLLWISAMNIGFLLTHICVLTFYIPANSQNLDIYHGCESQILPPHHCGHCHAIKEVFQSANYLKRFTCSHYTCSIGILLKCREHLISSYLNVTIGSWSWRTCLS